MTVKTVTTWNVLLTDEQIATSTAELNTRRETGTLIGFPNFEMGPGITVDIPTVVPYTVTREWATEADATNWITWLEQNIPGNHSTAIIS